MLGSADMADTLTLLSPLSGAPQTKVDGSVPGHELWHRSVSIPVSSASDLFEALTELQRMPEWYLVRGKVVAPDPSNMRRKTRDPEHIAPAPRQWLLLDLDEYQAELAPELFAADPARYAAEARAALPEGLAKASCFWSATGSAGIKSGARLRLAFWLDKPAEDARLKATPWRIPVDDSLFAPSQPHYTAAPLFRELADPVSGARCGVLPGTAEAILPEPRGRNQVLAQDELAKLCRKIIKTPQGSQRTVLNAGTYDLARRFPEADLPRADMIAVLSEAANKIGLEPWRIERTIQDAIADGSAAPKVAAWRDRLRRDQRGEPEATAGNTAIFVAEHEDLAGLLRWDSRALAPEWISPPPWRSTAGPVLDSDLTQLQVWLQARGLVVNNPRWIAAGLDKAAQEKPFDPVLEWLDSREPWDGTPRAEDFFIRHLGVADTALTRAQTRVFFIQAARRARATIEAPVQADYVLVLAGSQGLRKSSVWRELCPLPRFFRDDLPDIDTKDARIACADAWIVELAELVLKGRDVGAMKAFITARTDKFRPPYGRNEVLVPRRCVLVGSANEGEFLTDPTGNRRWFTFACTRRADHLAVRAERDQVWAEAMVWASTDERAYLGDHLEAEAAVDAEEHTEESPWFEALAAKLDRPPLGGSFLSRQLAPTGIVEYTTAVQAAELVTGKLPSQAELKEVKRVLRKLGWSVHRRWGGRYWARPGVDVNEDRADMGVN